MFIKDGIYTLTNVVIIDPTQVDLLPQSCAIQGFAAFDVVQVKEKSYHDQHSTDQFLPLAIEVFGCLHKHVDVFLHYFANAIWWLKGPKCPHIFTLATFLCQKVLITLQRIQASSILKLGDSYKFSYFLISTPSKHTFHHPDRSIGSC